MTRAALLLAALVLAGCALPTGRDFTRPAPTTFRLGQTTLDEVKKVYGDPGSEQAWSRSQGVLLGESAAVPAPFAVASVGGAVRTVTYSYSWMLGEAARSGVLPTRTLRLWFWNDKLVAYRAWSSFRADATGFDESKVGSIEAWKSLKADVLSTFGPPTGLATYPTVRDEGSEVLIYQGHEFHHRKAEVHSQVLYVLVNALGIVEDVRSESGQRPLPPAPVTPGVSVPVYTPPPSRKR